MGNMRKLQCGVQNLPEGMFVWYLQNGGGRISWAEFTRRATGLHGIKIDNAVLFIFSHIYLKLVKTLSKRKKN